MKEDGMFRKSVMMATELNVAGEFIYSAIEKINKMVHFDNVWDVFYFLYHLSVGIERVQKILLVICNDISEDEMEPFLESIKSHNHAMLHGKVKEKIKINTSKEQMELLNLLSTFYREERYKRFDFLNYNYEDRDLLINYVKKNCGEISYDYSLCKATPLNTDKVKEHFGRVIGRLCQKYYKAIVEESRSRNIYCYELQYDSAAERVFYCEEKDGSYQRKMEREKRAIKELLIYLRSPQAYNKFFECLDELEALPMDIALIQDYVADLCNKSVSIELIDEVDYLYEECVEDKREREQILSLIGDKGVIFDWEEEDEYKED